MHIKLQQLSHNCVSFFNVNSTQKPSIALTLVVDLANLARGLLVLDFFPPLSYVPLTFAFNGRVYVHTSVSERGPRTRENCANRFGVEPAKVAPRTWHRAVNQLPDEARTPPLLSSSSIDANWSSLEMIPRA